MRRIEKVVALSFMVLTLGHCITGFFIPSLPAWKMFSIMPRYRYEMRDVHGNELRIHDYVPRRSYLMCDAFVVGDIARWVILRYPELAPLTLRARIWSSREESKEVTFEVGYDAQRQPRFVVQES